MKSSLPRLKAMRLTLRRWSAEDLALMLDSAESAVLAWEAGERHPGVRKVQAICYALGCSSSALLFITAFAAVPGPRFIGQLRTAPNRKTSLPGLRALRTLRNLTTDALGEAIERPGATVRNWEAGSSHATARDLLWLVQVLQVTPDALLFSDGCGRAVHPPGRRELPPGVVI